MTEPEATTEPEDDEIPTSMRERIEPIVAHVPWGRVANAIGLLVLFAIVVPFVIYAIPQVAGADQSYVVLSGSMEPEISPGDVILVEEVDASSIEEGDVITFVRSDDARPTTHRVEEVSDRDGDPEFVTKGDANENPDQEPVAASQVQGRIPSIGGHPFVIPLIGHVIQFAGTQLGFATLVVLPIALFVLSEVWEIASANRGASNRSSEADRSVDREYSPLESPPEWPDEPPDGSEASDEWLSLQADELKLGLALAGVFAAYSVWVAYATFAVWAIGVATSVVTTFLLLGGLYVSGKTAGTEGASSPSELPSGRACDPVAPPEDATGVSTVDEPAPLGELWETGPDSRPHADREEPAAGDRPIDATDETAPAGTERAIDDLRDAGEEATDASAGGVGDD